MACEDAEECVIDREYGSIEFVKEGTILSTTEIIELRRGLISGVKWCLNMEDMETGKRQVLKAKYSESGSEKFDFQSHETVKLEKHEKCSFQCKEKASDCSSQQIYKEDECCCVCKNQHRSGSCHKDQIWDSEVCECKCKNYSKCSTGLYFNTRTCRCNTVSLL
ncbi:uncharacterized protein LOC111086579 [Limulus polyphemus]|uniref:Uncharacterized protein LOC111086579 n=1 Tax=Limulus polyphemus TaxID=6850 RepID=A0ABM1SPV6_LIMPO|nr:uncharacterized protein LOC111086579 [Limulus polyphemus]